MGAAVGMQHSGTNVETPQLSHYANTDPADVQRYLDYYVTMDPWLTSAHTIPAGSVVDGRRFLPDEQFRQTEFCNDFLSSGNLYWLIAAIDVPPPRALSCMSFMRSRDAPEFGAREHRILRELLPHVQTCLGIQRRLRTFETRVEMLEQTLDAINFGIVLLDPADRVVYCNQQAEQLLRDQSELAVRHGSLRARNHSTAQRLAKLLATANGKEKILLDRRPGAMTLGLGEGRSPLRVLVAPFRGRIHDDLLTVTTIVFLSTNQTTRLGNHDFLRQVYQLTVIEAKCASLLADGNSLDEIAEHLHATRHTVRSHLQNLFRKTGTNRQGALVAALNRELAALYALRIRDEPV